MIDKEGTIEAFFALLRAGLWEQSVRLSGFAPVDFGAVYRIADEQSVVGLIAAGLEHVEDMKVAKQDAIPFMKYVLTLEARNSAMDSFIGAIVGRMQEAGIRPVLMKGQGVARCYARPQWRTSGDVDLFVADKDYQAAREFLVPLASSVDDEHIYTRHIGMHIDSWLVELHGSMRGGLSRKMDECIDELQADTFDNESVRTWQNGTTAVSLPSADNDILFIFTHFIKHFYREGICVRQLCDWCRILWTYREEIDTGYLESRLRSMRLMTEWKVFAAYAVARLGMPSSAMPFYDPAPKWRRKVERLHAFIIEAGDSDSGRDKGDRRKHSFLIRKTISLWRRFRDAANHACIFPLDSVRFFLRILSVGLRAAAKEG